MHTYAHTHTTPEDLPARIEITPPCIHTVMPWRPQVTEGFSSIFTYRGLPGQREGRWGNLTWADTTAFMDRCAASKEDPRCPI